MLLQRSKRVGWIQELCSRDTSGSAINKTQVTPSFCCQRNDFQLMTMAVVYVDLNVQLAIMAN